MKAMFGGCPLLPDNGDEIKGNGLKMHQKRFRLDIRNNLFPGRARGTGCPPREVVQSPSLEVFQSRVDVALRTWSVGMVGMDWWLGQVILEVFSNLHDFMSQAGHGTATFPLHCSGMMELDDLKGPFQPKPFY